MFTWFICITLPDVNGGLKTEMRIHQQAFQDVVVLYDYSYPDIVNFYFSEVGAPPKSSVNYFYYYYTQNSAIR